MADNKNQFSKGEDITIRIFGDDTHPISEVEENTTEFALLLYVNNLDLSIAENRNKVVVVKSTDRTMSQDNDRGYVTFVAATETEDEYCLVHIPWPVTQNMESGDYTVDIVWGTEYNRVVFHQNSMVVLVDSTGTYVDENMDFNS